MAEELIEETEQTTSEELVAGGAEESTSQEEIVETDEAEPAKPAEKKSAKTTEPRKAPHGQKHQESVQHVDKTKTYPLNDAVELVKKTSYAKFDATVDIHVRLTSIKKGDDGVRGTVTLPHGTGRERRVVLITEEMIEKIEKGWLDFDVAVATPEMMPKLAKLAKILGPKGLMPNPKSGTVTSDPQKALEELKGGRVEFKADSLGNIHQPIGKVSWTNEKLVENFNVFVAALPKGRIKSITLAPTMGAGVKVS